MYVIEEGTRRDGRSVACSSGTEWFGASRAPQPRPHWTKPPWPPVAALGGHGLRLGGRAPR
eukprot:1218118-Pyramimonas_sp.AAC.1